MTDIIALIFLGWLFARFGWAAAAVAGVLAVIALIAGRRGKRGKKYRTGGSARPAGRVYPACGNDPEQAIEDEIEEEEWDEEEGL